MASNWEEEYCLDEPEQDEEIAEPIRRCEYCGYADPGGLVLCKATGKYFCNGSSIGIRSHIVHHLVKSNNNVIELPHENPFHHQKLECQFCKSKNIFTLGFAVSRTKGCNVFICRDKCLENPEADNGFAVDSGTWTPLISENILHPTLVPPADPAQMVPVGYKAVAVYEECSKIDPQITIAEAEKMRDKGKLPTVQSTYPDFKTYSYVYKKLVNREKLYDQVETSKYRYSGVKTTWTAINAGTWSASFKLSMMSTITKLGLGSSVQITINNDKYAGPVYKITPKGEIFVRIEKRPGKMPSSGSGHIVELLWSDVPYRRMHKALMNFEAPNAKPLHPAVKSIVTGNFEHLDDNIKGAKFNHNLLDGFADINGFGELNASQLEALSSSFVKRFSVIQGPPGTGKTFTIAALCYALAKAEKGQILVAAPSNVAARNLSTAIAKAHLRVTRIVAMNREGLELDDPTAINNIMENLSNESARRYRELRDQYYTTELSRAEEKEMDELKRRLESHLIQSSQVVCTTCSGASDKRVADINFPVVIVDEATQAVEPELLIPMLQSVGQVILVGDHCQLGPTVLSQEARSAGFGLSMIERLVRIGLKPIRLTVQYRMHPFLSAFPSNHFYEGSLQNGTSIVSRTPKRRVFNWPNPEVPFMFFDSSSGGTEEQSDTGCSWINRYETHVVSSLLTALYNSKVKPQSIGIITPYNGQIAYLNQYLMNVGPLSPAFYGALEIATVDSFQGSEKDYIIMSCVRNNNYGSIGFLKDYRRINVSLTRAKYGLFVIGSVKTLSGDQLWNALLHHAKNNHVLVEGGINDLRPSTTVIQVYEGDDEKHVRSSAAPLSSPNFTSPATQTITYFNSEIPAKPVISSKNR